MGKKEKSSYSGETGKTFRDGQITEGVIEMVKKKDVGLRESWSGEDSSDSKTNPTKSVGKSLLARVRVFKEKGK